MHRLPLSHHADLEQSKTYWWHRHRLAMVVQSAERHLIRGPVRYPSDTKLAESGALEPLSSGSGRQPLDSSAFRHQVMVILRA